MEIKEIGRWEKKEGLEVYYDDIFCMLITKTSSSLELKKPGQDLSIKLSIDKESQQLFSPRSSHLRVNLERSLLSILTDSGKLVIST
jgi:hypothetical protein